ncbi:ABC transporter permease [Escherichia coli]|uniref:ABC transporter permease n=1 Tax=Escherichia coli TaxID=562 RepID=A0A377BI31_ECOLX|nr:ABC transporter permease [Escherichia coli]
MAALAGIVFASQIGFIPNQTGTGLEMKAIAACVLAALVCSAVPVRSSVRYSAHGS